MPTDEKDAKKVRWTTTWYWLSTDRKLYRRSFNRPYLQCLHPNKIEELLAKLHEGVCGNHVGGLFISSLGNESGILVAADAKGCYRICTEM